MFVCNLKCCNNYCADSAMRLVDDERMMSDEARHIKQLEQLLEQKDSEMGRLREVASFTSIYLIYCILDICPKVWLKPAHFFKILRLHIIMFHTGNETFEKYDSLVNQRSLWIIMKIVMFLRSCVVRLGLAGKGSGGWTEVGEGWFNSFIGGWGKSSGPAGFFEETRKGT